MLTRILTPTPKPVLWCALLSDKHQAGYCTCSRRSCSCCHLSCRLRSSLGSHVQWSTLFARFSIGVSIWFTHTHIQKKKGRKGKECKKTGCTYTVTTAISMSTWKLVWDAETPVRSNATAKDIKHNLLPQAILSTLAAKISKMHIKWVTTKGKKNEKSCKKRK